MGEDEEAKLFGQNVQNRDVTSPHAQAFTGVFTFQVMSEGGPQPQSIIHFSISNQTVAVVNRRGQVTGKVVGTAVVHGTIQTVNEDTGKVIVFSQVLVLCSALLLLHLGTILGGGGRNNDEENLFSPLIWHAFNQAWEIRDLQWKTHRELGIVIDIIPILKELFKEQKHTRSYFVVAECPNDNKPTSYHKHLCPPHRHSLLA